MVYIVGFTVSMHGEKLVMDSVEKASHILLMDLDTGSRVLERNLGRKKIELLGEFAVVHDIVAIIAENALSETIEYMGENGVKVLVGFKGDLEGVINEIIGV